MRVFRVLAVPAAAIVLAVTGTTAAVSAAPVHPQAGLLHSHVEPLIRPVAGHSAVSPRGTTFNPNPTTNNWGGYIATGPAGAFTSVTSSWVQPAGACAGGGQAAFWVGLDGAGTSTVEQTGTVVDCTSGTAVYRGWYELYPAAPVYYGDTLRPGDNLTATVSRAGTSYTFTLADGTQHWTETHTVAGGAGLQNASAEIIVEAPGGGPSGEWPLANFGFNGFRSSAINGGALATSGAAPFDLSDPVGGGYATTGPIDASTGAFPVSFGNGYDIAGSAKIALQSSNFSGSLWQTTPSGSGYLGQNIMAGTSPAITTLPNNGFEGAYQSTAGLLMVYGTQFTFNTQLGMMAGTSPSIAASSSGTFQVAFQANSGILYNFTLASGGVSTGYAMKAGTSPSIVALPSGGFETAFQGSNADMWEVGSSINFDTRLGMMAGTSPAIAAIPSTTFRVAFQANTGVLWTQTLSGGGVSTGYSEAAGTSPAICVLPSNGYQIAFQGGNGHLWEAGTFRNADTALPMRSGTSPSIMPLVGFPFQVAYQANTGILWTQAGNGAGVNMSTPMAANTSPSITP